MGRRSDLDKGSVTGGLVNEAFNTVKLVADNMEDVLNVSDNLDEISKLVGSSSLYVKNPSFDLGLDYWTPDNGGGLVELDDAFSVSGINSVKFTLTDIVDEPLLRSSPLLLKHHKVSIGFSTGNSTINTVVKFFLNVEGFDSAGAPTQTISTTVTVPGGGGIHNALFPQITFSDATTMVIFEIGLRYNFQVGAINIDSVISELEISSKSVLNESNLTLWLTDPQDVSSALDEVYTQAKNNNGLIDTGSITPVTSSNMNSVTITQDTTINLPLIEFGKGQKSILVIESDANPHNIIYNVLYKTLNSPPTSITANGFLIFNVYPSMLTGNTHVIEFIGGA